MAIQTKNCIQFTPFWEANCTAIPPISIPELPEVNQP